MATRSGSVDPGLLLWLLEETGMAERELAEALEHQSGLLALAGTADMREVAGGGRARRPRCEPGAGRLRAPPARRDRRDGGGARRPGHAGLHRRCGRAQRAGASGRRGRPRVPRRRAGPGAQRRRRAATPTSAPARQRCGRSSSRHERTSRSPARYAPWWRLGEVPRGKHPRSKKARKPIMCDCVAGPRGTGRILADYRAGPVAGRSGPPGQREPSGAGGDRSCRSLQLASGRLRATGFAPGGSGRAARRAPPRPSARRLCSACSERVEKREQRVGRDVDYAERRGACFLQAEAWLDPTDAMRVPTEKT